MGLIYESTRSGVIINESVRPRVYSQDVFNGVVHLCIGVSRKGPQNTAKFIRNKQEFVQVFGEIDYKLERKGSFFHRTVLKLLETGPVYCVSLMNVEDQDTLSWKAFSTSSSSYNLSRRSNPYRDFYDTTGFWNLDKDKILRSISPSLTDSGQILSFVNTSDMDATIWVVATNQNQFDIQAQNWFDEVPDWIEPTDYISDYMVRIVAVKGDYTQYDLLSQNPKYSNFFDNTGLKSNSINDFLRQNSVEVLYDASGSLIPYLQDREGNDLHIETIWNNNLDRHGLYLVYDFDGVQEEFRTGLVDLIGHNLTTLNRPKLDFLSYKENLLDEVILSETELSDGNNGWGNPNWTLQRANWNSRWQTSGISLKQNIISTTSTQFVSPLSIEQNNYVALGSRKIEIEQDQSFILELEEILVPGTQVALAAIATEFGIQYRLGSRTSLKSQPLIPSYEAEELLLGYWTIKQDETNQYVDQPTGVSAPIEGQSNDWFDLIQTEISDLDENQLILRFIGAANPQNQQHLFTKKLYNDLLNNIVEDVSIILDDRAHKQIIRKFNSRLEGPDYVAYIEVDPGASVNIRNISSLNGPVIYFRDTELLLQKEESAKTKDSPFSDGSGGIIGRDSQIYNDYFSGQLSSGDRILKDVATEAEIEFTRDGTLNLLTFNTQQPAMLPKRIWINSDGLNRGLYEIHDSFFDGTKTQWVLNRSIYVEKIKATIFDAAEELLLDFKTNGNDLWLDYIVRDLDVETWQPLQQPKKIRQDVRIVNHISDNMIKIDRKDVSRIKVGGMLARIMPENQSGIASGLTRIVDITNDASDTSLAVVTTRDDILADTVLGPDGNYLRTKYFEGIPDWVDTIKGTCLKGFKYPKNSLPDGTEDKIKEILSLLQPNLGLNENLANLDGIEWRYLTDTFDFGIDPQTKVWLADICRKHLSFGFINAPSASKLSKATGLNFSSQGSFDVDLLLRGGERETDVVNSYTLIDEPNSSWISYNFPFLRIFDEEKNRPFWVPPSSYVCDSFLRYKWLGQGNIWDAAAGIQQGSIEGAYEVEIGLNQDQADALARFGINPIIKNQENNLYIFSNKTAETRFTPTRSINVRESLIEVERRVRSVLLSYQWRFNTAETRLDLKREIDVVLQRFKEAGAISQFRTVVDDSNNTRQTVDKKIGVIDIFVEVLPAMRTINLNMIVLSTGAISNQEIFR